MPGAVLSMEEQRLAKEWYVNDSVAPGEIAKRLKRDKSTITRLLCKRLPRKKLGRKPILSEARVDALEEKLKELIKKADGQYEVTATMLKRSARCKASVPTIFKALHERNIYFRPMRRKPVLTAEDIKDRLAFAKKYAEKPGRWWKTALHMIIDVKFYSVYLHGTARQRAAQTGSRGAYRKPGEGLSDGYVKPDPRLKYNTGGKPVAVLAGVAKDKVVLWEYVDGNWNGETAAKFYAGPMLKALKAAQPNRRRFLILEDNDPAGFKSNKGMNAKESAHIEALTFPKHSPDLNVCDYALWHEVNRKMRIQERKWAADKTETRQQYLKRLKRTAMNLPADFVGKSISNMQDRCKRLIEAKGSRFEEGGKKRTQSV